MINYPHAYYLRFFLQKNINVLVWNYRSYGRSKRKGGCCGDLPSPSNIARDAQAVLVYAREVLGVRGKIGIYGRSMGGIPASFLVDYVDLVIVDRSFANFYDVAYYKFYGVSAILLLMVATFGWRSYNDINFYSKGEESERRTKAINNLNIKMK